MPLSLHVYRTKPCRINKKQNGYETNRFLFYPFSCRHAGTCPAHVGGVPATGARQLSVGQAIRTDRKGTRVRPLQCRKRLPAPSSPCPARPRTRVTSPRLPVEIPNLDIETVPKDQYQVMLEVQQVLWDGRDIRSRKTIDACRLGSGTGKTACRHVCLE